MVVRFTGITKRFPGVVANDGVSLELRRGEVHCLLGENGAGKSTLISVLAGLQQPDAGTIHIDGTAVALKSPAVSLEHGIGIVYQHSTLIGQLTVLENLMLGDTSRLRIDKRTAERRLGELAAMLGVDIDPDRRAGDLGLGEQQQVEIVKAMWRGSRVLVLDEPTSMLVPQAIAELTRSIDRLRAEGVAILFVTHKLHEAYAVGDTVTVLRSGRVVDSISARDLRGMSEPQMRLRVLEAMFGASRIGGERAAELDPPAPMPATAPEVLRLDSLSTRADRGETPLTDIALAIRAGEIVGVAGVDGQGQQHLAEVIAGQRSPVTGAVYVDGADVTSGDVKARRRLGIAYVTDDRLHEGIVGSMSVALNLVLNRIGDAPLWRFGRMQRAAVSEVADARIAEYDIRTATRDTPAGTLSGGNIQKLLLARELADSPRAVVFHKPSYGLDLKTVEHVRETIRSYAAGGGATLLISPDLDELVALSHRIVVLSQGIIVGEIQNDGEDVAERVGALIVGGQRVDTGAVPG